MDACSAALKEHIDRYLVEKPHQSLRSISLKAGVPYSPLWRIFQGKGTAEFGMAIAVINVVATADDAAAFLKAHFPDKAKIAHQIYGQHRAGLSSDVFRENLSRFVPNQVFSLAATRAGTTEERIAQIYGEKGSEALAELLECEILAREPSGRVVFPLGNFSIGNPDDFLTHFSLKLQGFDVGLLGTPGAVLGSLTETVNAVALDAIKSAIVDAYSKVNQIVLSKESEGGLPVFAGFAMCLLDKTEFSADQEAK